MKEPEFSHFVLTRFNVRSGVASLPASDEWLRDRLDIFAEWSLPSIRGQSVMPGFWLVFCDADSPNWFLEELGGLLGATGEIVLVKGIIEPAVYATAVADRLGGEEYVITTRMDNDDAIAHDFIARLQGFFDRQDSEFVNFTCGAQYKAGRFFARLDPSNAFISLIERRNESRMRTVYVDWHNRVAQHAPVRRVWSSFAWLQHVHGSNLENVVRGVPVTSASVLKHFSLSVPVEDVGPTILVRDGIASFVHLAWRVLSSFSRIRWLLQSFSSRKY